MCDIVFINATVNCALKRENNGTLLLGTKLLQAGFDVKILRFGEIESYDKDYPQFIQDMLARILEMNPHCVSFYTMSMDYHIMLRVARELKARNSGIITVFGGPQASTTAMDTMATAPYVDYICSGEGEDTVVPFFHAILRNNGQGLCRIPGLYYRQNGVTTFHNLPHPLCDLETLPHWDDRLLMEDLGTDLESETYYMPLDAGRGCPYSCTFCCTSQFWRRIYRLKSPERLVEDIRYYRDKFGIRSFNFSHDAFVTNKRLVEQVCDRILEEGLDITWRCSARVDCLTEELILKMKQAGLKLVELGIETGSPRMQKRINKRLNLENAKHMVKFMLRQGIRVMVFFMYGFPDETEAELNETLKLAFSLLDLGLARVSMAFCRFCPVTAMTEENFDKLVFDPSIKILSRDIFGYEEELEIIKENKAIFPFYYHLDTPVRKEYQYMHYFVDLYWRYPIAMKPLRKLYQGDNLQFYKDFVAANASYFAGDMDTLAAYLQEQPLQVFYNMADYLNVPYVRQLKALLKYSYDVTRLYQSPEDVTIHDTYEFNYVDMNMQRPVSQFTPGKTEILLEKKAGVPNIQVLNIQWGE